MYLKYQSKIFQCRKMHYDEYPVIYYWIVITEDSHLTFVADWVGALKLSSLEA